MQNKSSKKKTKKKLIHLFPINAFWSCVWREGLRVDTSFYL